MATVAYPDLETVEREVWLDYLESRIKNNMNNLIAITGKTGSGKTYTGLSIAQKLTARKYNKTFKPRQIVFTFEEFLEVLNDRDLLYKGMCIVFDEPQVSISSKAFQTKTNKAFNYIASTFRLLNLTVLFCMPYASDIDKSTRKLFHAEFQTAGIDRDKKVVKIKPYTLEYNARKDYFMTPFLKVVYKPPHKIKNVTQKINLWEVSKPTPDLIEVYEEKKKNFTQNLYKSLLKEFKKGENP